LIIILENKIIKNKQLESNATKAINKTASFFLTKFIEVTKRVNRQSQASRATTIRESLVLTSGITSVSAVVVSGLVVVDLRVDGVSGVVDGGDEAALAMDVVLDYSGGSVGLFEAVLALGLVTVAALAVFLDVVGVVVVHAVLVGVLRMLRTNSNS